MKYSKVFFLTLISLMLCSLSLHAATTDNTDYLCFTAEQAGSTIALNKWNSPNVISLQYSTNKNTWSTYTIGDIITLSNVKDKVYFRATSTNTSFSKETNYHFYRFNMSGKIAASGNVMSLLDKTCQQTTLPEYAFCHLFSGCTSLVSAPELPATTLTKSCYERMFFGCTSLVTAPKLPAATLAENCYSLMFDGCNSLVTAPALPAMTLAEGCYRSMFSGCTSLVTAPELPATTLANYCYSYIFSLCTSLVIAPELHATNLATACYIGMFNECTSLVSAPELPATTIAERCYDHMFYGCISLVTAPELPATTSARYCYYYMFSGCTALVSAPSLPATTLANYCYYHMFSDCTSLNAIEVAFSSWPTAQDALTDWVKGVAAKGTFTAPCELPDQRGANFIPEGWDKAGCEQEDPLDYLCFTAEEAGSTVALTKKGTPNTVSLEYSTDKKSWSAYSIGNKITLSNIGDKVYFRATNTNSNFNKDNSNYYNFVMSGKIAGSGNIISLLDKTCQQTTLPKYAFNALFFQCSSLASAPELPATTLARNCYNGMFNGCTSLVTAPKLPATTLAERCYDNMFSNCSSLQTAPELPATALADSCYYCMFFGCTSLVTAPELPATTLAESCYSGMFYGCSFLSTAPKLPATTLAEGCYSYMFDVCTSLVNAPELSATTLADFCYHSMFYGCSSLKKIQVAFTSWPTDIGILYSWVSGVASKGTFIAPCELPDQRGTSFIPEGWDKAGCEQEEDPLDYLCFTAEEDGSTVTLKSPSGYPNFISLEYSRDKKTWETYSIGNTITLSKKGDKVYLRANDVNERFSMDIGNYYHFVMSGKIAGSGNIMSLLDKTCQQTTLPKYAFHQLFIECSSLVSAPRLPATTLAEWCYRAMFSRCTSLIKAPELPAKTLAESCYAVMFAGCSSLKNAPELPATTLAYDCYDGMFSGCTSLLSAPKLPAMTLTEYCYAGMFSGCTSLATAPELPATKLTNKCYYRMFYGCTSLVSAPELPATTLAEGCYYEMFSHCSSLVTVPELPAKTLEIESYSYMFQRCILLNKIQVAFSSWPTARDALSYWVDDVATQGTFIAPCELPELHGINNIPNNWEKAGCEQKEEFTLTVTATEGGSATGSGTYEKGTPVTISATATDPCYTFVQWSDEVTENPRNIIVTQDSSLTAIFEAKTNPILPVVERYSWLLMLNMKAIHEMEYDFNEDAVRWYRVQGTPDDVNQPLWDDEFVCNGYSLTIDQNLAGTGSYYAVVDRLSVQAKSEELCEGKMRSEVITVTNPIPIIPKVSLSPTLVEANAPLHVSGLVPQETTLIRIFSATGQLIQEYRSQQQSEYTINAFSHPGCYYMHIENVQQITTLPYIVK